MYTYRISYIDGNIPTQDSPHPTPLHAGAVCRGTGGGHGAGVGNPFWVYVNIGYRMLDVYLYKHTYILFMKQVNQIETIRNRKANVF